jgi:hypothetical protein
MNSTNSTYKFDSHKDAASFMSIVARKINLNKGYCNVLSVFFSVYKIEIEQLVGMYYTLYYQDTYIFQISDNSKFVFSKLKYGF